MENIVKLSTMESKLIQRVIDRCNIIEDVDASDDIIWDVINDYKTYLKASEEVRDHVYESVCAALYGEIQEEPTAKKEVDQAAAEGIKLSKVVKDINMVIYRCKQDVQDKKITKRIKEKQLGILEGLKVKIQEEVKKAVNVMNKLHIDYKMTFGDMINDLHDLEYVVDQEIKDLERAYSRRNWTCQDHYMNNLVINNID